MNKHLLRKVTLLLLSMAFVPAMVSVPRTAYAQIISTYVPEQLQQLVAPIALYPDALLGEVLMASTYPLEVTEAAQWRNINPGVSGNYLTAALVQQPWDPSVKGLTIFPQVLQMMSNNLDWTENLGEAFLADQQGTMDAIQQLRRQAQASGALVSGRQLAVSLQNGEVLIQPTDPAQVYVPYYNPAAVFSPWPYPDYTPYAFAAPSGVIYASGGFFGYATGIFVVDALWGWDNWNWHDHRIDLDDHRWRNLDNGRAPERSGAWRFDPDHRHNVPYKDVTVRMHFVNAPVNTPHSYRGYNEDTDVSANVTNNRQEARPDSRLTDQQKNAEVHPQAPRQPAEIQHRIISEEQRRPEVRAPEPRHAAPPMFESFAPGHQVKAEAERGNTSAHVRVEPKRVEPARNNPSDNNRKDDKR